MSMIEPEGRVMGPEPAAPVEPYVEPEIAEPPVEVEEVIETPTTPEEQETFDRKYVEGLRDEAARYRTRARDYESTFGEMPEDIRAGWLELINMANSGDPQAMTVLGQALGFETPEPQYEEPPSLTREDATTIAHQQAQAVWQEGEQQRSHQDAIRGVNTEAKDLGYKEGTPEYVELLYFANSLDVNTLPQGQTVLQAADRQVKAYREAQYAEFIAKKEEEARTAPAVPTGNGVAPSMTQAPTSWEAARESLHERLSNM